MMIIIIYNIHNNYNIITTFFNINIIIIIIIIIIITLSRESPEVASCISLITGASYRVQGVM